MSIYKPSDDVSPALASRRRSKFDTRLLEVADLLKFDVDKSLDISSNNMLYRGSDKALHCRIVIPDELKDISYRQLEREYLAAKEEIASLRLSLLEKSAPCAPIDTVRKDDYDKLRDKYQSVLKECEILRDFQRKMMNV